MGLNPLRQNEPANQQRLVQGTTLLAGVSLILVIVNIVLASLNQNARAEVNQRQQTLTQAAQMNAVKNILVHSLVQQSDATKDPKIQDLLKRAGAAAGAGATP